jgi:hypothetical protein
MKRFCMCVIFGPYHKPTNPQPNSPSYATHLEFFFYLSQIGTKPEAHKTKFYKNFFAYVSYLDHTTNPQTHSPALLHMLHIESSIFTSLRLGSNHKPTKPSFIKLFCMCVILGPCHKPTNPELGLFYLSQIGTKPQAHKPRNKKVFCLCVIYRPYHKPTNLQPSSIYCICYTLRVLFLPLSDWDQTTSPQNQVL